MDFKAEKVNGEIIVKAISVKNGNDLEVHIPSLSLVNTLIKKEKEKDGVGDIQ